MPDLDDLSPAYGAFGRPGHGESLDDRFIAKLATEQQGVVATWQLRAHGYGRSAISRRAQGGRLHRRYRGVYAVGHDRLTTKGRWMAAVLACGPRAVLSHRAAAALWDLRPIPSGPIDVTVSGRASRGQRGIRVHNVRALHDDDRAGVDGVPVASLHRTLLDYAEVAPYQQLRHAIDAAERRGLLDGLELEALYARSLGRRGLKPLRAAIAELRGPAPWTQSELERRFLALIRGARLPEPRTNVIVNGFLVDCYWPQARLIVECDGYDYHKSRAKFDSDRRQDAKLMLAGCRVLRVTQPMIEPDPRELLSDLIALLSDGPAVAAASGR